MTESKNGTYYNFDKYEVQHIKFEPKTYTNPTTLPDGYYWFKPPVEVVDGKVWFLRNPLCCELQYLAGTFEELKK